MTTPLLAKHASVRLVVVSGFGQPRADCAVELLRNLDEPLPDGGFKEYTNSFSGLRGHSIPYSRYEVWVRCPDGSQGRKEVQVDQPDDLEIIATSERLLRTHDRKPALKIHLHTRINSGELWWVRLIGLYVPSDLTARFHASTGDATFFDPQPGRYIVTVQSTGGFFCTRRIDIFDAPKLWTFDPEHCFFKLDKQANLVPDP
jgi:hypothetical protein